MPLTYTATDEAGATESLTFEVTVNQALTLAGPVSAQAYTMGTEISPLVLPQATGGTGTPTYTLTGEVAGLTFDGPTRTLSGRPTAEGTVPLTYTATDEAGATESLTFEVTVNPALTLAGPVSAQAYTRGTAISPLVLPQATGGTGTPTYTLRGEVAGLTFDGPTRTLSGRPTAATNGAETLTYTATDEAGATESLTFEVTVNQELAFAETVSAKFYTVGRAVDTPAFPEATGGTGGLDLHADRCARGFNV